MKKLTIKQVDEILEATRYFSGKDLSGLDLKERDFEYSDFSYANLEKSDLSSSHFEDSDLSFANLSNTNLQFANFNNANLFRANLKGANFDYMQFRCTMLHFTADKNFFCQWAYSICTVDTQDPEIEKFKKDHLAKYANQWSGIEKHKLPKICLEREESK